MSKKMRKPGTEIKSIEDFDEKDAEILEDFVKDIVGGYERANRRFDILWFIGTHKEELMKEVL